VDLPGRRENRYFTAKEKTMARIFLIIFSLICIAAPVPAADNPEAAAPRTVLTPEQSAPKEQPRVVIYTLSTCPHCKAAKRYMTEHQIPFIDREVGSDSAHMAELMKIYDEMGVPKMERGVPLIIIDGRVRLQGFNKDKLEKGLEKSAG
jgi:glutaredoxin 3